jgi:hypothetical protein
MKKEVKSSMNLAIEPKGIDLVVEPYKYTKSDTEMMSKIIDHYNLTGKLMTLHKPKIKPKSKKELPAKP